MAGIFGTGKSPLEDAERQDFIRKVRSTLLKRVQGGTQSPMIAGPTAGRFGMMSGNLPSADERNAFTNRKIAIDRFGKYGRGGLDREKLRTETTLTREGMGNKMAVQGLANAGRLAVQESKDRGNIAERKLMESGQTRRFNRQLDAEREANAMRYGEGGLEERKLDILQNKAAPTPKIHTLARPGFEGGEDAFMMVKDPTTGAYRLQRLNAGGVDVPRGVSPEQDKQKRKKWDAMPPEEKAYWRKIIQQGGQ